MMNNMHVKCTVQYNFTYLFAFGYGGSSLLLGLFSICGEWRLLSSHGAWASHCSGFSCCRAQVRELQWLWHEDSLFIAPRLWSTGSVVVACGLSCSSACGISDQGSNSCLLHWRQILYHWPTRETCSMSFDKWTHHDKKDVEHFYYSQEFYLVLVFHHFFFSDNHLSALNL